MSIAKAAIDRRVVTGFTCIVLLCAGAVSYFSLGQLEDPEFTIKNAVVTTTYPGANAEEVELEVTDRIEIAVQEIPELKKVESISRAGLSIVKVEIQAKTPARMLPQIWDVLRKKVDDARSSLPPGAGVPDVGDDFGDVYGFLFALTGDGFSYFELEDYADGLRKELNLVQGVARVSMWGVQQRCIYVETQETQLTQLGISMESLINTLRAQNDVTNSGGLDLPQDRLRIELTGAFDSPQDIEDLLLSGTSVQLNLSDGSTSSGIETDELLRIRDIAQVRRGYVEPSQAIMRYNGEPAIGIAISNVSGANIVDLGRALDVRLAELTADLPIGVEVHRISWQSDAVSTSIRDFMVSLAQAVAIVVVVLWLAMGFRIAAIVSLGGLVFVIVMSLLVMSVWGIDLQRMSLGALIIAMGMMVDNAIVVADGIMVRIQQGMDRKQAAIEAATQPAWPLLGATVIAVMAFYPIYVSDEGAGEYCASLFQVVAISLLISWVLSVTITPLMCMWMLPDPEGNSEGEYDGPLFRQFRGLLEMAIRFRVVVLGVLAILLGASVFGFRYIDRTFFPDSARLQLMVEYWAPEGTRIQTVSRDVQQIEQHLLAQQDQVESVSAFVGQGPPRFYLPVESELPYSSYCQLIVNVRDLESLNQLIPDLSSWMHDNVPQARTFVRRYGLGPSKTWKVEARISGPAVADPVKLREIAQRGVEAFNVSPHTMVARTNWRQRTKKLVVNYQQNRARWSRVVREDVSTATRRAFDGYLVGQYREADKLYPILLRHVDNERQQLAGSVQALQVLSQYSTRPIPLSQVASEIDVRWEDPIIWRFNRRRTVTVQANPPDGVSADTLRKSVLPQFEQIAADLPPGYELEWGGEFESSQDSQKSLIPGMVPAAVIVALIIVALFNALRPPLIILCVIPFALIGVTVGLLVTGQSFGFLALLGAMSLAGMMIKNAIVLLDQIDIERAAGKSAYDAVIDSAMSRLRPVVLAAGTTVLGVIPLLQDVFWVAMAVTIMFGLAFGTVLTMVLLPVLYAAFFRLHAPK